MIHDIFLRCILWSRPRSWPMIFSSGKIQWGLHISSFTERISVRFAYQVPNPQTIPSWPIPGPLWWIFCIFCRLMVCTLRDVRYGNMDHWSLSSVLSDPFRVVRLHTSLQIENSICFNWWKVKHDVQPLPIQTKKLRWDMKIECLQTLTAEDDNKQRYREQNLRRSEWSTISLVS